MAGFYNSNLKYHGSSSIMSIAMTQIKIFMDEGYFNFVVSVVRQVSCENCSLFTMLHLITDAQTYEIMSINMCKYKPSKFDTMITVKYTITWRFHSSGLETGEDVRGKT